MEPMGFQPLASHFMLDGGTGLTVDFVDNDHLLVTFSSRGLIPRAADAQADDDDHLVEARLVELPSGKVLARTEWLLHDRVEYLWNMGHGRFLLRVRDKLTMLQPMQRLTDSDAFRGTPVLDLSANGEPRRIVALLLSSDDDLLTLETMRQLPAAVGAASAVSFSGDAGSEVQINFYRLDAVPEGFNARPAGMVRSPGPVSVPMTRAGILDMFPGGKDRWMFNFNEHAGKVDELAEWQTTCQPRAQFVSHSEFVAFGCRGSENGPVIAGFNLKGEEMWQQGLYETFVAPQFRYAPAAGRFALERMVTNGTPDIDFGLTDTLVGGEEVRVYQTETGKVLLKVNVAPVERAGGNYALSPDGMKLAAFDETAQRRTSKLGDEYMERATSLVVYPLPPLTGKEKAQIADLEEKAPADTGARIDAALIRMDKEDAPAAGGPAASAGAALPAGPAANTSASASGISGSDAVGVTTGSQSTPDGEPGNPAMTGQLPNAPGKPGESAAEDEPATRHGAPTLYQPGETSSAAKRGQ